MKRTKDQIIILQTDRAAIQIPDFFLIRDSRSVNRAIIAGISKAMGMSDPSIRVSPYSNELEHNYLWALGYLLSIPIQEIFR